MLRAFLLPNLGLMHIHRKWPYGRKNLQIIWDFACFSGHIQYLVIWLEAVTFCSCLESLWDRNCWSHLFFVLLAIHGTEIVSRRYADLWRRQGECSVNVSFIPGCSFTGEVHSSLLGLGNLDLMSCHLYDFCYSKWVLWWIYLFHMPWKRKTASMIFSGRVEDWLMQGLQGSVSHLILWQWQQILNAGSNLWMVAEVLPGASSLLKLVGYLWVMEFLPPPLWLLLRIKCQNN